MINLFTKLNRTVVLIILIICPVILLYGCASNKAAEVNTEGKKLITDITTNEDTQSTVVSVRSNGLLTYKSIKQVFPLGVLFFFPETSLDKIKKIYEPPDNDIINSISAKEIIEDDKTITSRIFISLKRDVAYDVSPDQTGLHISFPKKGVVANQTQPKAAKEEPKQQQPQPLAKKSAPKATRLKSVSATALQKNVVVNVQADGTIVNYKSFTIDNPPRIVIDMFNLKSPFDKEQRIVVKSKWLKKIRYFGHPDKVRVVLETPKAYVSKYSATPIDNGLLIHVGQKPLETKATPPAPAMAQAKEPATSARKTSEANEKVETKKYDKPAWVNRIDFSSEEAGKSAIIIGTTRPVTYEIKKVADRRVHLKLFDTNLPEYRKRALITTRFASAVDRITPVQTSAMKSETLFTIEMREAVAYYVDQKDNILRINFSASKIPPKPYEDAQLPAWKKVMAEAQAEPSAKAEPTAKAGPTTKIAKTKAPAATLRTARFVCKAKAAQ